MSRSHYEEWMCVTCVQRNVKYIQPKYQDCYCKRHYKEVRNWAIDEWEKIKEEENIKELK